MPGRNPRAWCVLLVALLIILPPVHAAPPPAGVDATPGIAAAGAAGTGASEAVAAPAATAGALAGSATAPIGATAGQAHDRAFRLLEARGVLPRGLPLSPHSLVSRGQLAVWLVRALARPGPVEASPGQALDLATGFGWIPAAWAGDAAAAGRPVTRADLAAIARAVLGPGTGRWPAGSPVPEDLADVPEPARQAALAALASGLLVPAADGRFHGEQEAAAGEIAAWLTRLLELRGVLFDEAGVLVARDPAAHALVVEMDGRDRVVRVDEGAAIYRNGQPADLAALRPGDELRWIWGIQDPPGRSGVIPVALAVDATFTDDAGELVENSWAGRRITVRDLRGRERTYAVEEGAAIFLNGRPATLAHLRAGDRVYLVLRAARGTVRMLDATRADIGGRLLRVDPVHGYLYLETQGAAFQVVAGDAVEVIRAGQQASLAALRPGDRVAVATTAPGIAAYVEAIPAGAADGDDAGEQATEPVPPAPAAAAHPASHPGGREGVARPVSPRRAPRGARGGAITPPPGTITPAAGGEGAGS